MAVDVWLLDEGLDANDFLWRQTWEISEQTLAAIIYAGWPKKELHEPRRLFMSPDNVYYRARKQLLEGKGLTQEQGEFVMALVAAGHCGFWADVQVDENRIAQISPIDKPLPHTIDDGKWEQAA